PTRSPLLPSTPLFRSVEAPPARIDDYARVEPVYEELEGWLSDTSAMVSMDALPPAARRYVERIEELVGARVRFVGVGPHRRQLLDRKSTRLNSSHVKI